MTISFGVAQTCEKCEVAFFLLGVVLRVPALIAITLAGAAFLGKAGAQEVARHSLARQQLKSSALPDYNIKMGQVMLTADAIVTAEYIDNVYLSASKMEEDFVVKPEFGLNAAWQVTQLNVLRLRTVIGYTKYLSHSDLDSQNLTLAPNSALTFAAYVGDVRIEIHDQFSLLTETYAEGAPGGIAKLPRFTNTIGIAVLWDMNDLLAMLGYDHYNFLTLGSAVSTSGDTADDVSRLDNSTDQLSMSLLLRLNSGTLFGVEGVIAFSQYPNDPASDFSSFSVGPSCEVQLTKYTSMALNAGFKGYSFEAGPPVLVQSESGDAAVVPGREAGTRNGYYVNLAIQHRLNRHYGDRLELGHEDQVDVLSGRTETNYLRYGSTFILNRSWTFGFGLYLQEVKASSDGIGFAEGDYLQWGWQVSTGYKVSDNLNLTISYQYTQKDSDEPMQSYTQNRLGFGLGYNF